MRRPPFRPALPALIAALALGAPAAHGQTQAPDDAPGRQALAVGIADQKTSWLLDSRFARLGVRHARLSMPYDVLDDPDTLEPVDIWIKGAHAAGVRTLVTFDRSRRPGRKSIAPTPEEFVRQLRRIRTRWPWLREFSTWNEANINRNPKITAQQWVALQKACPSCTILGADLLDREQVVRWARRFAEAAGRWPKAWGLHNYIDANLFSTRRTRELLRGIRGEIWLTETGGVVARNNASTVRFAGQGGQHAARATAYVFDVLAPLSPRITRLYLYHWDSPPGALSWDSGLIGPAGEERPALNVLRARLQRLARAASSLRAACTSGTPKPARRRTPGACGSQTTSGTSRRTTAP